MAERMTPEEFTAAVAARAELDEVEARLDEVEARLVAVSDQYAGLEALRDELWALAERLTGRAIGKPSLSGAARDS